LFSPANILANVYRMNQGYITSRVLAWVPNAEPYARGETVLTAIRASIVPRVLDPNKYIAGGSENFTRFTGMLLINGTSMNLSIPGEMYANFGALGGVLAMLAYGGMIGYIYRWFLKASRRSVLWWAWAPYVLYATLSGEDGFGETLNRITKAMLVMAVIVLVIPAWNALRARGAPASRAARRPA
jgi:hypothetical protein